MKNKWKKLLWRHALFVYARDNLIFFVNIYLWAQNSDLQVVALFNIGYLTLHMLMFPAWLRMVKKGKSEAIMKAGVLGIALILLSLVTIKEGVADYSLLLGAVVGVFNGMYWLINHIDSFDQSSNTDRASFVSYRRYFNGASKFMVPAVGWLCFAVTGSDQSAYNLIFMVSALSCAASFFLTEIPKRKESSLSVRQSIKELRATKYMPLALFNGFFYGFALRSALTILLLPILILEVVETESGLTAVQTAIELMALFGAYIFARFSRNTEYISSLFVITVISMTFGIAALLIELSTASYIVFTIANTIALSTGNIGTATMSNNFATTIKDYKEHRAEFFVIRELFAIPGFIASYVFVYFYSDLSQSSIRPLLISIIIAVAINNFINWFLWTHINNTSSNK